jgi:propeptide_C25
MRYIRTIFSLLLLAVCWRGEIFGQKVNYLYAGHDSTVLEVEFPSVRFETLEVQGQRSLLPYMPEGIYRQEASDPDLPNYALPMLMQPGQTASVRILSMELDTVPGVLIAPSRGMLIRTVDPSTVVRTFGPSYTNDGLFPTQSVEFAAPYWQGTNYGRSLQLYPLQYNPVKR